MVVLNAENAILRRQLSRNCCKIGFRHVQPMNLFYFRGDAVRTESAFYLGERVIGHPKYSVLNSSRDLVPGRSHRSSLLRNVEVKRTDTYAKEKLGTFLKFSRRTPCICLQFRMTEMTSSVIQFSSRLSAQVRTPDLLLAKRVASLSLVGWRSTFRSQGSR